ncbi:MAG TPA: dihydroneopterin aldolase [Gaiellaceae bacterium]|nr:dihydroneopterin aldolase [Gaiellaceae bacterium]
MIVELEGLRLHGFHGVNEIEQRLGQTFLYDVQLDVGERGADDRIEGAVDYRLVVAAVREVNERRFDLLEALATAVADELQRRFAPAWLRVRVRKPEVKPAGAAVTHTAVVVERPAVERP